MFHLRLLLLLPWLIWLNFFCYGFAIIFYFCLESKRVMVRWALSGRFRAFKQFKCYCFFLLLRYCLMPEVLCFFESILNNNSSLIWHIFVIKSSNIAISLFFCTFLLCFLYWKLETLRVITSDSAVLTNRRLHFQVLKGQHFYFSLSSKFCQNDSGLLQELDVAPGLPVTSPHGNCATVTSPHGNFATLSYTENLHCLHRNKTLNSRLL